MTIIVRTPLEAWIAARIGLKPGQRPTPARLEGWQLSRLNATLDQACRQSPFYRRQCKRRAKPRLTDLEEIRELPFTSAEDLRQDPLNLLCVSQSEVARVVTLRTSGTTGPPKRLFFSGEELESTIDFFQHGMSTLVGPGERVLILLPGDLPDSVGDLLRKGLSRMGVEGIVHGPVQDPALALQAIRDRRIDSLVGIPVQVLALARYPHGARIGHGAIRSVLLSTDYVPRAIVAAIQAAWGCRVFQHYGMTEMGFGGGVECAAHAGYHLREADLLFEIVDPVTGDPVSGGLPGEVVVTTLTRRAMPLIRYRTGDLAAWIDDPCPCGSTLRRMAPVRGRCQELRRLADGIVLEMNALDEALFALPKVINYQATLRSDGTGEHLTVTLFACQDDHSLPLRAATALEQLPAIRAATSSGALSVDPIAVILAFAPAASTAKRVIGDQRTKHPSNKEVII